MVFMKNIENSISFNKQEMSPYTNECNGEIDINHLFSVIWSGRFRILIITIFSILITLLFLLINPDTYITSSKILVNSNPYDIFGIESQDNNYNQNNLFVELTEENLIRDIAYKNGGDFSDFKALKFNKNSKTGEIFIQLSSNNKNTAYDVVSIYTNNINAILKEKELYRKTVMINKLDKIMPLYKNEILSHLSKIYAEQIFKISLLKSSELELVKVIQKPSKPVNVTRSKQFLYLFSSLMAGILLGLGFVLARYANNKNYGLS